MPDQPFDPLHLLVPRTERSLYDTSIQLTDETSPNAVLVTLSTQLAALSAMWGTAVRLGIEPDGDGPDTGHWVEINFESGVAWAQMTAWPARFGGAVPAQIDAELELAGWVLLTEGAEPEPYDHVTGLDPEQLSAWHRHAASLPVRRLVAVVGEDDLAEWADLIVDAVRRVIIPRTDRWYLYANVEVLDNGPFGEQPFSASAITGDWCIAIEKLLDPSQSNIAVWPSDSEGGVLCCDLGLHEYHEPPCPPPPWSRGTTNDDG